MSFAIALVFVDNYEEVMETVEEIRRPLLTALIERRIGVLAHDLQGIARKFEKDKFLLVLDREQLETLKTRRFDILDSVREIDAGNKLPVTLSIGAGTGDTPAAAMIQARAALDLALGRGGDQALIKDGDKYDFYGGDSPELAPAGNVKARVKFYALAELLAESDNVLIMGHKHMDMDCLGAAVGLRKLAAYIQHGRECRILINKDSLSPNVSGLYNRLAAESPDGFIDEAEALARLDNETLLVIADASRPQLTESQAVLDKTLALSGARLVVIDHHRLAADFIEGAVLTYQEPYASSTCELVCELMQHAKEQPELTAAEADAMLAGITVDTKRFTQKTGAKTFGAAAFLRRAGADTGRVQLLLRESLDDVISKAVTVAGAKILMGRTAVAVCNSGSDMVQISAQAADELMNVTDIDAAFVLCHNNPTSSGVYICARSLGKVNVQLLMERFGGGGHQTMAAAQLAGVDIETAMEALLRVLTES